MRCAKKNVVVISHLTSVSCDEHRQRSWLLAETWQDDDCTAAAFIKNINPQLDSKLININKNNTKID